MSVSGRARDALGRVGLTGYEIRAYSELLSAGELTASEVSRGAGVPYSKVYEVLGSLARKGWVGADGSRPTIYAAKSPATGLEAARRRMEAEFEADSAAVSGELGPLYERSGASERPEIWFISGAAAIASKILEMVDSCRREALIAVPGAGHELVRQALPRLRLLHERGVGITILTSEGTDPASLRALSRVADVRVRGGLFGGGIIADGRYVVIVLGPAAGGPPGPETAAVWADHAGLAGFARGYFEYLIKDAEGA